jgi:HJR/Mrr/RecB family endonuclease
MGSRRRRRKAEASDGLFAALALLVVAAMLYPKVFYYGLLAIIASAVVIAGIWLVRHDNKSVAASRNRTIVKSNVQERTETEQDTDLYSIWKSLTGIGKRGIATDRWNIDLLDALEWKRFEIVCAKYFEMRGFTSRTNLCGADGGIDIQLFTADSVGPDSVVQCKAWARKVRLDPVRGLLGSMTAVGVKKGIFMTTGDYTQDARDFAAKNGISLIGGKELLAKIGALAPEQQAELLAVATDGDYLTPTCPSCGIKMTLRTSSKDQSQFWGCLNYPRCKSRLHYTDDSRTARS